MPSLSLVSSIVLALIIFSVLKLTVTGIYAAIVEYLEAGERVKAAKLAQGLESNRIFKAAK